MPPNPPQPPNTVIHPGGVPDCPACRRVAQVRTLEYSSFICELSETVVALHKHQTWEGWCVLLLKEHAEHLHELEAGRYLRVMEDVRTVARAVVRAFAPRRVNYECLGNVLPHLHWHVIPRYPAPIDPDPGSTVWVRPTHEQESGVEPSRQAELIRRLHAAGIGQQG